MPVEQGRQVPAAGEGGHLVRVDVGELGVLAEADQQAGPGEVADRRRGHPQRRPQGLRQPVRCHPGPDRAPQRGPDRLRVGGLHHRPRPHPRTHGKGARGSGVRRWCGRMRPGLLSTGRAPSAGRPGPGADLDGGPTPIEAVSLQQRPRAGALEAASLRRLCTAGVSGFRATR